MTTPPVAPRRPHQHARISGDVSDPYAWLVNKDDPATISYLEAENTFADTWFAPHHATIDAIFAEIKARTKEDDSAPPVQKGKYWYTTRTVAGSSYAIHSRGLTRDTAEAILLLDENVEADGHDYFSLNAFDISTDEKSLAWSSDTDGSERYTLRFRDISSQTDLPDVLTDTTWGGTAWSSDSQYLFYVTPDEAMRPHQVWRHAIGTNQSADVLVFTEPDERFFVGLELSRSEQWIIIESASKTSSESWLIDAGEPTSKMQLVAERQDDVEYTVDHWGDSFVIVTNLDAHDFQVCTAPTEDPSAWTTFIAHTAGNRIVHFDCFADFGVMQRWVDGQQQLYIVQRSGDVKNIVVASEPHEVEMDSNPEFKCATVRINMQSLVTPPTILDYTVADSGTVVLKRVEVPDVDLGNYVATRTWAIASDGTRIPLDIVRHRDTPADGTAPALLYAYGSYELSTPPWFSTARLSLLDRGWVWALAHPRGGGEMGRGWYLDGKLLNKRNTFTDTIACARSLVDAKICGEKIVLRGGSAGGLLVGACINFEPTLFHAAVAEVPFVDVVSSMSDPDLPLTITEWEEWGDPRVEPWASYMLSYSPYDNVQPVKYPALYVTAGLNDPRVSYHEPAKWVARLRHDSPTTLVVMKCEMGAGHGGPTGRYERWRDEARTLTFILVATSQ